jgi:RecA/RadA recombinase
MSKDRFKRFKKVIENPFANVVSDGVYCDTAGYVDTGSYALNALLSGSIYGGIPNNKVTCFAGEEATGKTFYVLGIVKHFLETHPDAVVFFFESEGSVTSEIFKKRNIDADRVLVIGVRTVEEFRSQCLKLIDECLEEPEESRTPVLFILDSLGNLSTQKEISDVTSGKDTVDMGKRARLIKAAFRAITMPLSLLGASIVITNHTYDNPGKLYASKTMGGGSGLKFSGNNIIFLSKSKIKDGTTRVGSIIKCLNQKSRTTKEELRVETRLLHESGLDRYYGLIDIALEAGIWKKLSTQIIINDKKFYEKTIASNAEKFFTKEVLDAIDKYTQENFVYSAPAPEEVLESMLNGSEDGNTEEAVGELN